MKNKKIIFIIVLIILLVLGIILIQKEKELPKDDNTLYKVSFNNTVLRVERYDYSLGQNQIVGVEKSTDKGKNYKRVTTEPITISMEPKFIFINEQLGFIISKPNISKQNNYQGIKVTQDGGQTFIDGKINYYNPNIETITIENIPYKENNLLKLPCSIYQIKSDNTGYENKELIFISTDNGLTWNLEK